MLHDCRGREKKILVWITLLLCIQLLSSGALAQSPVNFFIQQLDNRNGLSNSSINNIYKDTDSLIWVATWDGLNMYDGTSFHVYNYSKENNYKTIGSNVIQRVTEDHSRNIWISTIEGVSRYDKRSGKFQNYFYDEGQRSSISEQEYQMAVDHKGSVFCLTSKYGLTYYDEKSDTFRTCHIGASDARIIQLAFDESNHLWVLNSNGALQTYSEKGKDFTALKSYSVHPVSHFFPVNGKMFYSTPSNELFQIDFLTGLQSRVMQMNYGLTSMIFYQNHYLLAWSSKGYSVYDNDFRSSDFLMAEAAQMQNIKLTSLARGSEQILWLGTDGNGIIKIYPRTKSFGTISTSENGSPYNKPVRAFCQEDGNLWFGTKGNGIVKIPDFWSATPNASRRENYLAPQQLDNNAVYALKKGSDDLIYIGTDGKGIGAYDLRNKKFYKWSSVRNHDLYPEFGSVYAMQQDEDHSLWLGTSGYGLIHLKIEREITGGGLSVSFVEKYMFNNSNTGPANDIIYSLADAGKNRLWIGCRYGGLNLLDKNTRTFKTFKAFTYEGSLSNNDILSLFKDSRDRLWVGTSYGLNWIRGAEASSAQPEFKKFTTANGLPNNTIHGIMEDSLRNVWASTNRGLVEVDPESGKISNYQQIDGLQSNEFCDGAVWKDPFNQLFFGGIYGINYFLPQNIKRSEAIPNLLVSNIMMSGKAANENSFAVMKPASGDPMDFTIERKDDFFELEMKTLSFLNAEKCEYAWFMEGYDNIWHYPGTSGKITYSNILPGNYTLKVKWSNGEGVWTPEISMLNLKVKQYFWLTPYAWMCYFLLGCLLTYTIFNYIRNRREIRQQLVLEHALRTREEELHQDRISFFTNIAHELQTPLTLIMGSIELGMEKTFLPRDQKQKPHFLSLVHQQASKLTYLVNQLMEFRKVEAGFYKNHFVNLNISELLQNLSEPFIPLGEQNRINYEIDIAAGMTGWADKDKLEKIIFNLLSNAFKYTASNQTIRLSANENKQNGSLNISVANSGSDISRSELNKLFDKFYVAGTTDKMGTGIGLAFTRQLVLLLNGTIEVGNQNGWISFNVQLPLPDKTGVQLPAEKRLISGNPSYLYKSITSHHGISGNGSATDHNKEAIIETLNTQARKNILIIEDEPEIRILLRDILKDDYIVSEAEDGHAAIGLLQKLIPDLIICDVMMPNMNGLDLCNKIKNTPATCHIPLMMLSARDTVEQQMEGYEVGADAYMPKPFHLPHLKIRVRKMLEQAERLHQFFRNERATDSLVEADLPPTDRQFLDNLVKIIEGHMDETEFNAEQIEKILCLSKMQLYRKLKTLTAMTPGEFIKHLRLKQAAQLLSTTRLSVSEIFIRTGFNNQSYFFREFKKRYQAAPNEYRAQQSLHI